MGALRWLLLLVVLGAWAIRLPIVFDSTLHPDEALYAYWGRLIASGQDPWLSTVPVYKPPLLPYVVALAQLAFGTSDVGLRVPGLCAGLLTVPLTAALARALYRDGWLAGPAAVVVALSPFATVFSATVFPDPLMTVLGLGACVAAARSWEACTTDAAPLRRSMVAGLVAGLAFASKQTGLAWAPLVLLLLLMPPGAAGRRVLSFGIGFISPVALAFAWDVVRIGRGARSFWAVGISGFGGLRLVWPHELLPRLAEWARVAGYLLGSPALSLAFLLGIVALAYVGLRPGWGRARSLIDLTLIGFTAAHVFVHWLIAFPVWDRYLLPLAPIVAVLVSRAAHVVLGAATGLPRPRRPSADIEPRYQAMRVAASVSCAVALLALAAIMLGPAVEASQGELPVGGDRGASSGIARVAKYLAGQPEGSVVYHHWQGWHYRYYLFSGPVFLAYWPHPAWLVADVAAFGSRQPRFLAFPAGEDRGRVEHRLQKVGYRLRPELTTRTEHGRPTFTLYRVVTSRDAPDP